MNDSEGFVVEYRKIIKWQWYTDVNTAHLFRHCILRANYTDTKWRNIEVKRGSFITSLPALSKETGLTVSQIRTALKKLESTGEIADKSASKYRIITVKNYDLYQSHSRKYRSQIADKSQSNRSQIAADNKYNNNNKGTREVCSLREHTSRRGEESPSAVSPPKGEPPSAEKKKQEPLCWAEWNRYSKSKGYSPEEAEIEWNKRGGKFSEQATAAVREHNKKVAKSDS